MTMSRYLAASHDSLIRSGRRVVEEHDARQARLTRIADGFFLAAIITFGVVGAVAIILSAISL